MTAVTQLYPPKLHTQHQRLMAVRDYLRGQRFWTTQGLITEATGVTGPQMRKLCQLYPRDFISSTYGYKTTARATTYEIIEAAQALIHRAEKIQRRARLLLDVS